MVYQSYEAATGPLTKRGAGKVYYWLITALSEGLKERNFIILTHHHTTGDKIRVAWKDRFGMNGRMSMQIDVSRLGLYEKDQLTNLGVPTVKL